MAKEPFVPLTKEVIDEWTETAVEKALLERETLVERQLVPELRKELAVKEAQEREIARIESEIDVMNLASEFVLRIKGGEYEGAYACFALHTPGVSAEITALGVYEGAEALKSYYVDYLTKTAGSEGCFKMDHLCTPVVEVARDNQSARGMWLSVGMEALSRKDLSAPYTEPLSVWAFNPWCFDFIRENGTWKIWHLTVFEDVETVYERSWSETADDKIPVDPAAPKATRSSTRHKPFTSKRMPILHAEPPVAYVSWADGMGF